MFEVRKFTPATARFEILFSGYLLKAVEFLKGLAPREREQCFLTYTGDGEDGV